MFFLQTPEWEAFQQRLGKPTHRVGGPSTPLGTSILAVEESTPLGRYWYVGRPELDERGLRELMKAAQTAKVLFTRIDPVSELRIPNYEFRVRQTLPTQPRDSLVLDLTPSTDQILANFHEKTRYNIRLAERHGLVIEESSDPDHRAMKAFLSFARRTADRQAFRYHPDSYYKTMLKVLNEPGNEGISASVLVAHKDNGPMAAMIVLYANDTAYYLHGASWYERRQYMAPHLLQWAAIQRAKERGCRAYDFWGIAPPVAGSEVASSKGYQFDPNHSWAGVTRFKLGFGGEVVRFPDSVDLVLQPLKYRAYTIARAIRRMGR